MYCHAPAAGQCASCGALSCADCVELVMGVTTPRATCRLCLQRGRAPAGLSVFLRGALLCVAVLLAVLVLLVYLTR